MSPETCWVPLPGALVVMLRAHKEAQERERETAENLWGESEYVFTERLGGPLSPNTDCHDGKRLLETRGSMTVDCTTPATRPARS